jgi:hypothetical protein
VTHLIKSFAIRNKLLATYFKNFGIHTFVVTNFNNSGTHTCHNTYIRSDLYVRCDFEYL